MVAAKKPGRLEQVQERREIALAELEIARAERDLEAVKSPPPPAPEPPPPPPPEHDPDECLACVVRRAAEAMETQTKIAEQLNNTLGLYVGTLWRLEGRLSADAPKEGG